MLEKLRNWLRRQKFKREVRSLEREFYDVCAVSRGVYDSRTLMAVAIRKAEIRQALAVARGNLTADYPPGTRFTWEQA